MRVRAIDGRVLEDMSGAGAGAAAGCCWNCCFHAHLDGRVLGRFCLGTLRGAVGESGDDAGAFWEIDGRLQGGCWFVLAASSWCCPHHHDAVEPIRTSLLLQQSRVMVRRYHHDVVGRVMVLLESLRCGVMVRRCDHDAVNTMMMLNFMMLPSRSP